MYKAIKSVFKRVNSLFDKHLDLKMTPNCKYSKMEILSVIFYTGMHCTYVERIVDELKNLRHRLVPSSDMVHYHLKKNDPFMLKAQLDRILEDTIKNLARARLLKQRYMVAIDIHTRLYYGKRDKTWIVGIEKKRGTCYGYQFATLDLVVAGERFTLKAIPVLPLTKKEDLVRELIEYARRYLKIHIVLLDRGFYTIEVIKTLLKLEVDFLMPAIKYANIQQLLKVYFNKTWFQQAYVLGKGEREVGFNLFGKYSWEKKEWHVFATNLNIKDKRDVEFYVGYYRKRWGIETGYRVKQDFLIITTSNSYSVRLFFFFLSVIFYNTWVACNLIYGKERKLEPEKSMITTWQVKCVITITIEKTMQNSIS